MHAQDRALERYGKELSTYDILSIQHAISSGQSTFLYNSEQKKKRRFCFVKLNHIPYKVLYEKTKRNIKIITIYPFDVEEYNNILEQKLLEREQKYVQFLKSRGYIVYKRAK